MHEYNERKILSTKDTKEHEEEEKERVSTELTENTEKSYFFRVFREFRGHSFFFFFVFLRVLRGSLLSLVAVRRASTAAPKFGYPLSHSAGEPQLLGIKANTRFAPTLGGSYGRTLCSPPNIRLYRKCSGRLYRSTGCGPPRWISDNDYYIPLDIRRFLSKNIPTCLSLSSSFCVAITGA